LLSIFPRILHFYAVSEFAQYFVFSIVFALSAFVLAAVFFRMFQLWRLGHIVDLIDQITKQILGFVLGVETAGKSDIGASNATQDRLLVDLAVVLLFDAFHDERNDVSAYFLALIHDEKTRPAPRFLPEQFFDL
jgi:hypothetical protein